MAAVAAVSHGNVLHAGFGQGAASSSSMTLPWITTPRGTLTSISFLTAPLVHSNSTSRDQVWLALGREWP